MNTQVELTPELLELYWLAMYSSKLEVDAPGRPGRKILIVRKGPPVEVLWALRDQGLLLDEWPSSTYFYFTEEGLRKGEALKSKYLCA